MIDEKYRILFKKQRDEQKIRLENRPFSDYHNKLVANLYLAPNRLKQQAEKAKHEETIKNWIFKLKQIKLNQKNRYNNQKSHFVIVRRMDKNGSLYDFATYPMNITNKKVIKLVKEMIEDYKQKTKEYTAIVAFTREEYFKRLRNEGPWKNVAMEWCNSNEA